MLRALAVDADLALVALVACCLRLGKGGPGRCAPTLLTGKSWRGGPHGSGRIDLDDSGGPWEVTETAPSFAENTVKALDFGATASRAWPSFENACWSSLLYRDLLQKVLQAGLQTEVPETTNH